MPGRNVELSIEALQQQLETLTQPGDKTPADGHELPAEILDILIAHLKELDLARKQMRQQDRELLAAHRRYQALFEFAPDGYVVTDAQGIIREANRAAEILFNIPPHYLVGKPLAVYIVSKQRTLFRRRLIDLKKSPQEMIGLTWELCLQPRKGLSFPALLTLLPRYNENWELNSINWLVRDITASKQAEEDLRASTEFSRAILNSLDAHIAVLNREGEIVAVNAGWERFARENGDPTLARTGVGINYLDVCRRARGEFADVAREALAGIRAVLNGSESNFTFEYPCPTPTKSRWFVMYATALAHGRGGAVISHVNISERKQVEEEMIHLLEEVHRQRVQLRALTRRLGEVQEAERKQLAGELHDQVGQKLTALDLNLNIIRAKLVNLESDSLVQAKLADSLTLVEETATSIRDVMATLRPPMLDDYGLAATLRWYGAQMAERGGFTLTVLDETALPHLPSTVENVLFRIAQEALTNVVKHAQASAVTIQLEQDNGLVRMIVADNGRGFEQAKLSETRNWSRWGLMTMAERAEAAGGRCRVESHLNQGTKIIVEVRR